MGASIPQRPCNPPPPPPPLHPLSWGHAGQWDASFSGHSYYRVRDFTPGSGGAVIANLSLSLGFAYGSAYVDHARARFWVFGTPHDRCGHAVMPNNTGVYAFYSDDAQLRTWTRVRTDVPWNVDGKGYNVAVAGVAAPSPAGLPPHSHVLIADHGSLFINAATDGNLSAGWVAVPPASPPFAWPDSCQCPSIRFLADGYYYVLEGGHAIWLLRSRDLRSWELPPGRRAPIITPSAGDGAVAPGWASVIDASDRYYASRGRNTTRQMLAHLGDWDHNANDADMCCEGGTTPVPYALINWGPSSQAAPPTGGLNGPSSMQALIHVPNVTLDALLGSFFEPGREHDAPPLLA